MHITNGVQYGYRGVIVALPRNYFRQKCFLHIHTHTNYGGRVKADC